MREVESEPCECGYPRAVGSKAGEANQRPDSGNLCGLGPCLPLTLRWVGVRGSSSSSPRPGQAISAAPSACLGASGREPPCPSLPAQHQHGTTYLKRTMFIVTRGTSWLVWRNKDRAPGVLWAPEKAGRAGSSCEVWAQGTLLPGCRATRPPSRPGRSRSWLPGNPAPSQPLRTGGEGLTRPCTSSGESQRGPHCPHVEVGSGSMVVPQDVAGIGFRTPCPGPSCVCGCRVLRPLLLRAGLQAFPRALGAGGERAGS